MNKNNIKKYFKILFIPISMLLCLSIFLINTFASVGWEQQENGNIKSLNLLEGGENISGQNVALYFNCSLLANHTYTFKLYDGNNSGAYSLWSADSNNNFIEEFTSSTGVNNSITFTTTSNSSKIGIYPNNINNANLMLNEGSVILDYFPYGIYYTTPQSSNFMEYLIGENYFSSGRSMVYQTNTESPYWDRQIYPSNRSCYYTIGNTSIGDYIVGKTLYLQNLSYDLIEGLKLDSNYVYARNTTLSLKPSFNFANSSVTYLNIPCKFLNLDIYCPNGVFECSCYVGSGLEIGSTDGNDRVYFQQSGDYIHIDFDDDDNRWMYEIEIVLNHSNNSFVYPSNIVSNTNDTLQWDLYQIGYDDGYRGAEGKISYLQSQINDLNSRVSSLTTANNILSEQNQQLRNSLSNNFGFDDVFFALADTPFKTVSNMLGFDLFGVNLFNALVGFITVLACIWLLKKFL